MMTSLRILLSCLIFEAVVPCRLAMAERVSPLRTVTYWALLFDLEREDVLACTCSTPTSSVTDLRSPEVMYPLDGSMP